MSHLATSDERDDFNKCAMGDLEQRVLVAWNKSSINFDRDSALVHLQNLQKILDGMRGGKRSFFPVDRYCVGR